MRRQDILPDCRVKDNRKFIQTKIGIHVPVYCANCGADGGMCPEENMTFMFYLCNKCVETCGQIAGTMMIPDEVFWAQVAADQEGERQREEERGVY